VHCFTAIFVSRCVLPSAVLSSIQLTVRRRQGQFIGIFFNGFACDILGRVLYLNLNYFCPNSLVLLLLCLG